MKLTLKCYRCSMSDGFMSSLSIFSFLCVLCIPKSVAMPNSHNSTSGAFEAGQGVFLHYEVSGKCSTQKWILLVHGLGASTEDWADVRDQLGEESCVVSLDLKGHGQSSRPKDGDYSLDTQANLLLRFISAYGHGDTVLVGHSYGGAVALLATVKAQEKGRPLPISALVLVDVPAYPQPVPKFFRVLYMPVVGRLVSLVPSRMAAKYSLRKAFYDQGKISRQIIGRYAVAVPATTWVASSGSLPIGYFAFLAA